MVPCAIKSEPILKIITAFLSFLIKPIRVLQNWQLLQTSLFQKKLLLSSSDSLLLLLEGRQVKPTSKHISRGNQHLLPNHKHLYQPQIKQISLLKSKCFIYHPLKGKQVKKRQRLLYLIPPLEECYRPVFMLQCIDFLGKHCRAELKYFSCSVKWFIVFAVRAQSSNVSDTTYQTSSNCKFYEG